MKDSRIRSKATYHKALKELQKYGYLKYAPSYHPQRASEIEILNEQTVFLNEQTVNSDERK